MRTVKLIDIFVSCPAEMSKTREHIEKECSQININFRQETKPFRVEVLHLNNSAFSGSGKTGQSVVDRDIGSYDIYIGLMKSRFGVPTGDFGSGTESEYNVAKVCKGTGACREVAFLFNPDNRLPDNVAPKVLKEHAANVEKVAKFKKSIQRDGVLTVDCAELDDFARQVRGIINRVVNEITLETSSAKTTERVLKNMIGDVKYPD